MSGSTLGTIFKVTTWGESHGMAIGVVVDGCPAGLPLCEEDIQKVLNLRKPGQSKFSTPRKEDDKVEILSGVFEGKTTGTPISMIVRNQTQRSSDYSEIAECYRPGHADYTFDKKFGFRDYRGGGRSSARETIGRVAAGAIALKILKEMGITFLTYAKSIGDIEIDPKNFDEEEIANNPLHMPDAKAAEQAMRLLEEKQKELDSVGGCIECVVSHLPAGLGEPVFDKLDANLGKAIFSIGAVKAVEIGDGIQVARSFGSLNNDAFYMDGQEVKKRTNHAGGVLGGISDGSALVFRTYIKPTPSIFKEQQTVNTKGEDIAIKIKGRHDPIIVPRAVIVVEAMAALTIVDLLFMNMTSRMDKIKDFYLGEKAYV